MHNEPSLSRTPLSMPYMIPDADFNKKLKITYKNVEATEQFLNEGVVDFSIPGYVVQHGYRFVKAMKNDQYRVIALGDKPITVYLVELRFRKDVVPGKTTCTQIKVWRSLEPEYENAIKYFPQNFFEYLLQKFSIVVSDEEQTGDGKRFWERMIRLTLKLGYMLYVADGTKSEDWILSRIESADELAEQWDSFCWGDNQDIHKNRLLVISKNSLIDSTSCRHSSSYYAFKGDNFDKVANLERVNEIVRLLNYKGLGLDILGNFSLDLLENKQKK
ncbi:hypothetical protein AB6G19_23330 [Providencia manganoxydans]